jgi:hypothetical protein
MSEIGRRLFKDGPDVSDRISAHHLVSMRYRSEGNTLARGNAEISVRVKE